MTSSQTSVQLAYGRTGLDVELPTERTTVVRPVHAPAAADPSAVLRTALRSPVAGPPLREAVPAGARVAASLCDGTRPQPREAMIEALLDELDGIVAREDVVLLVATGTHLGNTDAELRAMLGDQIIDSVRVINHDCRDPQMLTWCGTHGADVPVWLNRHWVEADVRITTGFVEPHFFAGFSGGPKLWRLGWPAGDRAHAARCGSYRQRGGHVGGLRGQPRARRRARNRCGDRGGFRLRRRAER
jgi:hypothetical protein